MCGLLVSALRLRLYAFVRRRGHDPDSAADLVQGLFAHLLEHNTLAAADPGRGRFRDFVKGVLFHLVADHHRRRQRQPRPLLADHPEPVTDSPPGAEGEQAFLDSWRDELLARAWSALAEVERARGQPYHTVLRFRAEHPDLPSPRMAEQLGPVLGKPLTAVGVRKTLDRAREKFADLLLDEIAQALEEPTAEQLEQELIDLGLLDHCLPALRRRAGRR